MGLGSFLKGLDSSSSNNGGLADIGSPAPMSGNDVGSILVTPQSSNSPAAPPPPGAIPEQGGAAGGVTLPVPTSAEPPAAPLAGFDVGVSAKKN